MNGSKYSIFQEKRIKQKCRNECLLKIKQFEIIIFRIFLQKNEGDFKMWYFLKNYRRSGEEAHKFLIKIGVVYRRGGRGEGGGKNCFSLMMYGFCSNNALYSTSISFTMFVFRFILFDTWHYYFFGSNFGLVSPIKVLFIKKHETLFCSFLNMKK